MKPLIVHSKLLHCCLVLIGALCFCCWQNSTLTLTQITFESARLPGSFDGYTIVQISDLHSKRFGKAQKRLLEKIRALSPDLIVVTGDLVDSRRFDLAPVVELMTQAVELAPVFYVSGNHEARCGRYDEVCTTLQELGVTLLDNKSQTIQCQGESITLSGLADPFFLATPDSTAQASTREALYALEQTQNFQILLSHRPELFDLYLEYGMDLTFSGHAHGGQWRLPLVGGLYAPDQGLFPRYTAGLYQKESSGMVVSRGLGNSLFPLRLFNRPELVAVTLRAVEN